MSEKFFEIANAIYKGKLPASFFCIVMPNCLFLGTICSQDEIVKFLETDALGMDKNSPMDKAIQQISAKMTFLESADKNPTALQEKIVTMVSVRILSGDAEIQLPIVHILANQVMAWGQGNLDADDPTD